MTKTAPCYATYSTYTAAFEAAYPEKRHEAIMADFLKAIEDIPQEDNIGTKTITIVDHYDYADAMDRMQVTIPANWNVRACRIFATFVCNLPADAKYIINTGPSVASETEIPADQSRLTAYLDGGSDYIMVYVSCSESQVNVLPSTRIVSLLRLWLPKNATVEDLREKICGKLRIFTEERRTKFALYHNGERLEIGKTIDAMGIVNNDVLTFFWGKSGPDHGHSTTPAYTYQRLTANRRPKTIQQLVDEGADLKAMQRERTSEMKKLSRAEIFKKGNFCFGEQADYARLDLDGFRLVLNYSSVQATAGYGDAGKRYHFLFGWHLGHFVDWIQGGLNVAENIFPQAVHSNRLTDMDGARRLSAPGHRPIRTVLRRKQQAGPPNVTTRAQAKKLAEASASASKADESESIEATPKVPEADSPPLILNVIEEIDQFLAKFEAAGSITPAPLVIPAIAPLKSAGFAKLLADAQADPPVFEGFSDYAREKRMKALATAVIAAHDAKEIDDTTARKALATALLKHMPLTPGGRREIGNQALMGILTLYGL